MAVVAGAEGRSRVAEPASLTTICISARIGQEGLLLAPELLGEIGRGAAEAIPSLQRLLVTGTPYARTQAAQALSVY